MKLQELVYYCDSHPQHQEEIISNNWKYWDMTLDEMIKELGEWKPLPIKEGFDIWKLKLNNFLMTVFN
ncbi:hypothetical protein QWY87_13565 [Lutimonas halocynthiae]|uniref:hypothetical protein n=1 Tax=Lutimonas halocynthiae TaxID=1446477 RepID=UPI0025B39452|nr:hypothetical protein [Lutimonas halocynthiae]MDN3643739.1 hypothetical protein [Lutimonas halocynthiae]